MTPEVSEFSYGFALTNQIVSWSGLHAAPIFPSLLEEGKEGGGYDVKLTFPGFPLYLQFKRGFPMRRRSAGEIRSGTTALSVPFHRFHITESGVSNQHAMLFALDSGSARVFYAAPRFDARAQLDVAWQTNTVAERSIFVRPREIGALDEASHHVSYDANGAYICSEPRRIRAFTAIQLFEDLTERLQEEREPLSQRLDAFESQIYRAKERARLAIDKELKLPGGDRYAEPRLIEDLSSGEFPQTLPTTLKREPRELTAPQQKLRRLADTALREFNAQVVIVQSDEAFRTPKKDEGE